MEYADPMAWDTAATRQRLLDAGARQFAAHGLAGARMDAIGRDAGVNKERVYQYFGNKDGLFAAVLDDRLTLLLQAAGTVGAGPFGVGAYAGSLCDHFASHPDLARLLAWESLEASGNRENEGDTGAESRAATCAAQSHAIHSALPGISRAEATQLLLSIVALCASWWTLTKVGAMIAPGLGTAARRDAIVTHVTALARDALARTPPAHA